MYRNLFPRFTAAELSPVDDASYDVEYSGGTWKSLGGTSLSLEAGSYLFWQTGDRLPLARCLHSGSSFTDAGTSDKPATITLTETTSLRFQLTLRAEHTYKDARVTPVLIKNK